MIISGFPGVGKTYYSKNTKQSVLDSDSSTFSWIKPGIRNPKFPENYIHHIKQNLDRFDVVLVSSHKTVRDALVANGLFFILVYPDRSLKCEYIQRFINRGNDQSFVDMLDKNWDKFIDEMDSQNSCCAFRLTSGRFLSDFPLLNMK